MAQFKVFYQDGSTDVVEARSAAKAREKGEADYGEVQRVVIQPEVEDDADLDADAEEEHEDEECEKDEK